MVTWWVACLRWERERTVHPILSSRPLSSPPGHPQWHSLNLDAWVFWAAWDEAALFAQWRSKHAFAAHARIQSSRAHQGEQKHKGTLPPFVACSFNSALLSHSIAPLSFLRSKDPVKGLTVLFSLPLFHFAFPWNHFSHHFEPGASTVIHYCSPAAKYRTQFTRDEQ
ncbi:hypothetical protein VTK56DRAFT_8791 [Thermocarpiscus australiensis]